MSTPPKYDDTWIENKSLDLLAKENTLSGSIMYYLLRKTIPAKPTEPKPTVPKPTEPKPTPTIPKAASKK